MIVDKDTYFIAQDDKKTIVHHGFVAKGLAMDIGLKNKKIVYTFSEYKDELYNLNITDFDIDYLPEKEQLIIEKAVIEEKIKAIEDKEIKPIVK
jgi:hypothetical protein